MPKNVKRYFEKFDTVPLKWTYYCHDWIQRKLIMISKMAIRVVEFSNGEYKIRKIFAKQSTYPKEIFEL